MKIFSICTPTLYTTRIPVCSTQQKYDCTFVAEKKNGWGLEGALEEKQVKFGLSIPEARKIHDEMVKKYQEIRGGESVINEGIKIQY